MKQIFADTFYWVALINPQDNWHQRAREVTSSLKNVKLVTTDEVLVELLNFMSVRGVNRKRRTVEFIDDLLQNPRLQVIPQNRESFLQGFELYRRRPDKEYSLTDCISLTSSPP
ncbi:MAG: type II toxin-antitoxin system VapC family toxin [Microcystis aeruginosa Ma_QC_Ch_20071001_S25]|jgi:predicted nucleic acid-binding protein|uniref:Type II toxin-antitoxin system VapC family toxin n=1 Tax=Microcystis aeruginosa Ma_QC_Ch_20071001_S25D TaxID=2486250 RepID=A0A552G4U2_MICAE|nr:MULTISPECIES: PIN domain-containing protein [unclassified Microcystis]MCA2763595.1 nucleic acid-binding protein [Microcystis sp. M151S2]TRU48219.1 MAG: type II toxin-antitoxin system VapC family toxin [Microcystis aeruginosa Ma_QC_Ch_20071001_S25]TRU53998.1 MAG: type II toxin-antitoxin system VapC family toxin [Microcystis aeruginosa Ma_QC_Ch_20071001_S25D]TRU59873.1 MAG: type II toxin-antitoxin system VapC family toxin [Microcystis aeruginosa Ma_QC_Ch_20071001_M135]MCA2643407.1 nucleic aci